MLTTFPAIFSSKHLFFSAFLKNFHPCLNVVRLEIHAETREREDDLVGLVVHPLVPEGLTGSLVVSGRTAPEHGEPVYLVQVARVEGVGEPLGKKFELGRVHVVPGDLAHGGHGHVLSHLENIGLKKY